MDQIGYDCIRPADLPTKSPSSANSQSNADLTSSFDCYCFCCKRFGTTNRDLISLDCLGL